MISPTIQETRLSLPLQTRGKVRDVYQVDPDRLLIVATDRLSAFDHVLPTPIPEKGRILTQLSAFWFSRTGALARNHMQSADVDEIARIVPALQDVRSDIYAGRTMLVQRCDRIDVECVVRGYLTGSALEEYTATDTVAGIRLPAGLRNGDRLPEPIFTPATKAAHGHDQNITFEQMEEMLGAPTATRLRTISLALYEGAAQHAQARALILADTKFEFGWSDGELVLIDEALTPDSSRYWDAASYPQSLASFDKQYVRDYLNRIGWNHEPPAPELPAEVVEATRDRYRETYRRLTGEDVEAALRTSHRHG
jgi:phosphoribosylaminoimidazole-succinocarboxamide synthase